MENLNLTLEEFKAAITQPFSGKDTNKPSTRGANWTFTFENENKGTHLTFKVRRPKGFKINSPVLVYIMQGNDNEESFKFVGSSYGNYVKLSDKADKTSKVLQAKKVLDWALSLNEKPEGFNILSEARCCMCSKKLTNPDSIHRLIGPECAKKHNTSKVSKA